MPTDPPAPASGREEPPQPRVAGGFQLAEALVVLALLGIAILAVVPAAASMLAGARMAAGARDLALALQAQRWRSVAVGRYHGLLFERVGEGWQWLEVRDDNGNGLRTAEVRAGVDPVLGGPHRMEDRVSRVTLGFPDLPAVPNIPPRGGVIGGLDDPVKFGNSDLVSFSPLGTGSSGTIYLTDGREGLYAIVLFGPTGRVRVWRFDARLARWFL
jgi:type II secretory pathway pseudopilin PulG